MSSKSSNERKYTNLRDINSNLADNPKISDHNKQVLEDFFDEWREEVTESTLKDYASQWNRIAQNIDFKLDQADREEEIETDSKFTEFEYVLDMEKMVKLSLRPRS